MSDTVPDLAEERRRRIEAAKERLRRFDWSWTDLFDAYVLSGMYEREVIDQRTRELCAVAALTVLARPAQLADHIKGALRHGASQQEVVEVILQASVYGGFPVTMAGLTSFEAVIEELGLELETGNGPA